MPVEKLCTQVAKSDRLARELKALFWSYDVDVIVEARNGFRVVLHGGEPFDFSYTGGIGDESPVAVSTMSQSRNV